jgi:hypothetical protein
MDSPDPKQNTKFLPSLSDERNLGPAATVGEAVQAMMETEGWDELVAATEDSLHFEQRLLMVEAPGQRPEENYERKVGQWAGRRQVLTLADALVARGKDASKRMRAAEAA